MLRKQNWTVNVSWCDKAEDQMQCVKSEEGYIFLQEKLFSFNYFIQRFFFFGLPIA